MQFNAKDDFVNDYQAELQEELDAENRLEVEQDHDFDRVDHKPTSDEVDKDKRSTTMDFWTEQAFENERNGFVSALDDHQEEL